MQISSMVVKHFDLLAKLNEVFLNQKREAHGQIFCFVMRKNCEGKHSLNSSRKVYWIYFSSQIVECGKNSSVKNNYTA